MYWYEYWAHSSPMVSENLFRLVSNGNAVPLMCFHFSQHFYAHTCNQFLLHISNWLEPILRVVIFFFLYFFPFLYLFVLCFGERRSVHICQNIKNALHYSEKVRCAISLPIRVNLIWFDLTVCMCVQYMYAVNTIW